MLAIVVVTLAWRARRYRSWFRVPVRRDDQLTFRPDRDAVTVSAASDGFDVPGDHGRMGQTVFLRLTVKTTLLGRLFDPFIDIRDGDGTWTHRQYFERGAAGQRFLNVSAVFQNRGGIRLARVALHGSSIRWKREASLLMFDPPGTEGATVVVVAPHPDDAEIAAFGLYASHRSWVVTVTAGEKGTADLSTVVPRGHGVRWNASLRVSDSLTVPQSGSVPPERCLNLAYPDGELENMAKEQSRPFRLRCEESLSRGSLRGRNQPTKFQQGTPECSWNDLVADLTLLLENAKPDIVVCPHPLLDVHPDHVFTAVAIERAMRNLPQKPRLVFLYAVHPRDVPLYPVGSAESLAAPPPWQDGEWIAESLYSHPLAPAMRTAKYFAVEAMHDLRTFGNEEPKSAYDFLRTVKREVAAYLGGTALHPTSYLRRAPRPNEIYYVVSANTLSELVERALVSSQTG